MKASRLLSILMLLQARGRLTAGALAQAMEVSERTILRDIDQLSAAGVPLWGERGRQGGFQLGFFELKWFTPAPALARLQVRVHHAPLDGAGPHDGDLDDQIVELRRLQARQHVHLRPAFDLEDANGIPALQHPVHIRGLTRHIVER
eukprot:gene20139-39770_t